MADIKDINKMNITDEDLGLGPSPDKKVANKKQVDKVTDKKVNIDEGPEKAKEAMRMAAANAALKASIDANEKLSSREADKTYIIEKQRYMLNKCKTDEKRIFKGNKLFAKIFGKVYTFTYNTIPVTVRFDGTEQEFPKFIYDKIMEKINETSESNTNKVEIEDLTD